MTTAPSKDRPMPQREKNVRGSEAVACLHCGRGFQPRRQGHVFCSSVCRYRGERPVSERVSNDESIQRLFDPSRDPEELVRDDDWHPAAGSPFAELDWMHTVGTRRSWYLRLKQDGYP